MNVKTLLATGGHIEETASSLAALSVAVKSLSGHPLLPRAAGETLAKVLSTMSMLHASVQVLATQVDDLETQAARQRQALGAAAVEWRHPLPLVLGEDGHQLPAGA